MGSCGCSIKTDVSVSKPPISPAVFFCIFMEDDGLFIYLVDFIMSTICIDLIFYHLSELTPGLEDCENMIQVTSSRVQLSDKLWAEPVADCLAVLSARCLRHRLEAWSELPGEFVNACLMSWSQSCQVSLSMLV